jgi:3-deoxy-manno-octulosonate cytidylyltransferase (CMP-KDO synthetase)
MARTLIVIPVRLQSGRLPRKPLLEAAGKSILRWTYGQAADTGFRVTVATSDQEILSHCRLFGMNCTITRSDHRNGTSRCAEAAKDLGADVIVNWQCDEPLIEPDDVIRLVNNIGVATWPIATLVGPAALPQHLTDPNIVKVVISDRQRCHWFSRAPMSGSMVHYGVYALQMRTLLNIGALPPSRSSMCENLEQLTWIDNDWPIRSVPVYDYHVSINTVEDLNEMERMKKLT